MMNDICLECIGDLALRDRLKPKSHRLKCSYCGARRRGVSIEELADEVDEPLRLNLAIGPLEPRFSVESDSPDYEQQGEDLTWLLQEVLEVDLKPAEDLQAALIERDPADPREGEESFYASDQLYVETDLPHPWEYNEVWEDFARRIKHGRRFFDAENQQRLGQILGTPVTRSRPHSRLRL